MALPIPRSGAPVLQAASENQDSTETDDRRIIWAFLWTLFGFKLATVLIILWMAGGSSEANLLLGATGWPFLVIPAFAMAGPLVYFYRVRRVRARREQLLRAEWMLD